MATYRAPFESKPGRGMRHVLSSSSQTRPGSSSIKTLYPLRRWWKRTPRPTNPKKVGARVVVTTRKKRTTGVIVETLTQERTYLLEYQVYGTRFRNSFCRVRRDDNGKIITVYDHHLQVI